VNYGWYWNNTGIFNDWMDTTPLVEMSLLGLFVSFSVQMDFDMHLESQINKDIFTQ
jgi:hypothetical protein